MKIVNRALAVVLTACTGIGAAVGCGGDSDSGGSADTGLPPTQLLSDVTPSEARQACEAVVDSFQRRFSQERITRATCTIAAALQSENASACNSFRDGCIENAMEPGSETMMELEIGFDDPEQCEMAEFPDCGDTTVADLETCLADAQELMDAVLTRFDCSDAGNIDLDDIESLGFEPPASCETVTCGTDAGPFGLGGASDP